MRTDPQDWQPPLVPLIGMGMGCERLSEKALGFIRRAEVLAGGKRHVEAFEGHPAQKIEISASLDEFFRQIEAVCRGKRTAVLASGDPLFFGIGKKLGDRLGRDNLIVFPNTTSVQGLFARIVEPWEGVRVVSLHGKRGDDLAWVSLLAGSSPCVFFTDAEHTPRWIAQTMLSTGFLDWEIVVGEDLGLTSESVRRMSPADAAETDFTPLNIVALLPCRTGESPASVRDAPIFGLPDEAFAHQEGLITKAEVRAVVIAQLALKPGLILWDIGAGSGSVSIEAARIASLRRVFAVEKHPDRYKDLCRNIDRFKCSAVEAIQSGAAEALARMEDPDRVFIGGSGKDLEEILMVSSARLRPGGLIVMTAVTLDSLDVMRNFWSSRLFQVSITQIQASRSVPIGKSIRMEALNPVFVLRASPIQK